MNWRPSSSMDDKGKNDALPRWLGHVIYYIFLGWNKKKPICLGKERFPNYFLANKWELLQGNETVKKCSYYVWNIPKGGKETDSDKANISVIWCPKLLTVVEAECSPLTLKIKHSSLVAPNIMTGYWNALQLVLVMCQGLSHLSGPHCISPVKKKKKIKQLLFIATGSQCRAGENAWVCRDGAA